MADTFLHILCLCLNGQVCQPQVWCIKLLTSFNKCGTIGETLRKKCLEEYHTLIGKLHL